MSLRTPQEQRPLPPYQRTFRNSAPAEGQSKRRKDPGWMKILLVVVLVFLVTFLGLRGDMRQKVAGSAMPNTQALAVKGPFIQAPLSLAQGDKLHHFPPYI